MLVIDGKPHRLLEVIDFQGEIAAAGPDEEQTMRAIVERVPGLIGADGALIATTAGDHLVLRAGSGVDPWLIGRRYPRGASLSGLALARRSALVSREARGDARVEAAACRGLGARSLLCAPLVDQGEELGALTAFAARPAGFIQLFLFPTIPKKGTAGGGGTGGGGQVCAESRSVTLTG